MRFIGIPFELMLDSFRLPQCRAPRQTALNHSAPGVSPPLEHSQFRSHRTNPATAFLVGKHYRLLPMRAAEATTPPGGKPLHYCIAQAAGAAKAATGSALVESEQWYCNRPPHSTKNKENCACLDVAHSSIDCLPYCR
jgi:hypothetical protein